MQRRNTATQAAVLRLFEEEGLALSPEKVEQRLAGLSINRSTIYRILHRCVDTGQLHRFTGIDGRQYFAACTDCTQNHHLHDHPHFRCLECGRVECLPHSLDIQLPRGYSLAEVNAIITGSCADCGAGEAGC